jgi:ABC-type phosphate transport system auxiliary subunit
MSAELFEQISALIEASDRDLDRIERTLTDGYAHALSLEAEKWRLEKRMAEVAQNLDRGDAHDMAQELTSLARRLNGNAGELSVLRDRLGDLRRHAETVRS